MNSQEVLSLYETVAVITTEMLIAARNRDWEQLLALESRCSSHVQQLKSSEPLEPLPSTVRQRKVAIIQKILADDREIRTITEPWMQQLSALMNNAGTERKLNQAYGTQQGR
jgi:flagellar protein FliT